MQFFLDPQNGVVEESNEIFEALYVRPDSSYALNA